MPKVSVIVPCYNQAQYLDECLNSVLNQTFTNWECIIVNDGSPDNTEEVAKNWVEKDSRFRYLKKENGGLSSARNFGIRNSNGYYLLPLDSDDLINITFLEKTLNKLESDEKIGAVGTYVQNFGAQNFVWECKGGNHIDYLIDNQSTTTCVFKKLLFEQLKGYDESMRKGLEDWDFWIRLTSLGYNIFIIKEALFLYRRKSDSMINDSFNNFYSINKTMIEKNIELYKHNCAIVLAKKNREILDLRTEKYYYERLIKNLEKSLVFKAIRYFLYKTGKL